MMISHFTTNIMAPPRKKKISVAEKKNLAKEKGKKSSQKHGQGLGSRKKFSSLLANWHENKYQCGSQRQLKFSSPGKSVYKTQSAVVNALETRKMKECLLEGSRSPDKGNQPIEVN